MLRTKLTDNEAPHENLYKIRNEDIRGNQVALETLEDDMPELETAQVFSRDSSAEVTISSVPLILGSVQVYLDSMTAWCNNAYYCSLRTERSWLHGRSFSVNYKKWVSSALSISLNCTPS